MWALEVENTKVRCMKVSKEYLKQNKIATQITQMLGWERIICAFKPSPPLKKNYNWKWDTLEFFSEALAHCKSTLTEGTCTNISTELVRIPLHHCCISNPFFSSSAPYLLWKSEYATENNDPIQLFSSWTRGRNFFPSSSWAREFCIFPAVQ